MPEAFGVFSRGILLGLMVAAPVGPVGLLCIRRTLQKGMPVGFATGFGAAFADAFFSAVAAFGVTAIMNLINANLPLLYLVGGLFLLVVAWHTWHDVPRQPEPEEAQEKRLAKLGVHLGGYAKAMVSSFLITLANPATLFGAIAMIATFGGLHDRAEAGAMVGGIFTGSSLWWLLLSSGTALVRQRITETSVHWINRITALALAPLALWAMLKGLVNLLGP